MWEAVLSVACISLALSSLSIKSPQQITGILLFQAFFVVIYLGLVKPFMWLSYILFLVFLGGMMILFSYMSSLTPNSQFFDLISNYWTIMFISASVMTVIWFMLIYNKSDSSGNLETNSEMYIKGMFSLESGLMYSYIVVYLLVALLSVTWVVKITNAPLRAGEWCIS